MLVGDTTIQEFLHAYKKGQREFTNLSFPENGSTEGEDLRGVVLIDSFLFNNFQNANLEGAKFIHCNIKCADFSGAILKDGVIKNCSIEGMSLIGANVDGLKFETNYYQGNEMSQDDLHWFTKPN